MSKFTRPRLTPYGEEVPQVFDVFQVTVPLEALVYRVFNDDSSAEDGGTWCTEAQCYVDVRAGAVCSPFEVKEHVRDDVMRYYRRHYHPKWGPHTVTLTCSARVRTVYGAQFYSGSGTPITP